MSLVISRSIPYYNARLEPRNKILDGAGQGFWTTGPNTYAASTGHQPLIVSDYWNVGFSDNYVTNSLAPWLAGMTGFRVVQLGIAQHLSGVDISADIVAGDYDIKINTLLTNLNNLGLYVYFRQGYECNGNWNPYSDKAAYKAAFQHITDLIRAHAIASKAATVWCISYEGSASYSDWYPGDSYVDWWSIDVFGDDSFAHSTTAAFLAAAHAARKPVMIGESTARGGVTDAKWTNWFAPYFAWVAANRGIKALCYINWDWTGTSNPSWGNCLLSQSALVEANCTSEMSKSMYLHGTTQVAFEAAL